MTSLYRGLITQRELAAAVERARNQRVGVDMNEQKA